MTIPYLMNCPHSGEGWCLDCVKPLVEENDLIFACQNMVQALQLIADGPGLIAQHGDALELGIKALKKRNLL